LIEEAIEATVLIPTFNRATLLDETLTWLAATRVPAGFRWEVIVIDNNSTDGTRAVVERHATAFPVPLRYLFETRQGRSSALNAGIAAARGAVLAFTGLALAFRRFYAWISKRAAKRAAVGLETAKDTP
jgi:glycosyltransferase involved in cell wall biosynthesis